MSPLRSRPVFECLKGCLHRSLLVSQSPEATRLEAAGLALDSEGEVVCCDARQDKHWVTGPDGQRWENYVVLADAHPELEGKTVADVNVKLTGVDVGEVVRHHQDAPAGRDVLPPPHP